MDIKNFLLTYKLTLERNFFNLKQGKKFLAYKLTLEWKILKLIN